jgi:monoamine oxidase
MTFVLSRRALMLSGLLPVSTAWAAPPQLPPGSGRGKTVAVLGAGIAGLVSTLLLRRAGYQCTVLEARARPGGRVWTVRSGDTIVETDSTQQVKWTADRDLYFNAGPARLSHHHQGILGYCRDLDVPLETFVNDNRAGLIQIDGKFDGKPQQIRRLAADMRGGVAALAALAAPPDGSLNGLLRAFGGLKRDMTYDGSSRAGYDEGDFPGAGDQAGKPRPPLPLGSLVGTGLALAFPESWNQAPTMLQPVGGMDRIPYALVRAIGGNIAYQHEVEQITRIGERARVIALDRKTGKRVAVEADYVICTLPLSVLKSIPADFAPPVKQAIADGARGYAPTVKVAFEAPRRWWETDDRIYGGISWTSRDIGQIWYPSHGFHGKKGIVIGAYIWDVAAAERYGAMTPDQRRIAAIADGERLHPGYGQLVGAAASVAWAKIPYSLGGWIEWDEVPGGRRTAYPILLAGDGPFHFAGEHMSYVNAWQEGAVQSAHYTVSEIAARAKGEPRR